MDLVLIKIGSSEWDFMWEWLAKHPFNEGIEEPTVVLNDGEKWEYMGTFKQGIRAIHGFRHRFHPKCDCVKSMSVEASKDFNPDTDIEKKFKL